MSAVLTDYKKEYRNLERVGRARQNITTDVKPSNSFKVHRTQIFPRQDSFYKILQTVLVLCNMAYKYIPLRCSY